MLCGKEAAVSLLAAAVCHLEKVTIELVYKQVSTANYVCCTHSGTVAGRGSAPVAPLEKQRPARAAANGVAAVLMHLRESNAGSPQASPRGKGKPSKAPAAAVEKLQPVGALQAAAAQATKVGWRCYTGGGRVFSVT